MRSNGDLTGLERAAAPQAPKAPGALFGPHHQCPRPRRVVIVHAFERSAERGDVYVLKQILHDWDDDRCVAILDPVSPGMSEHSKVLFIEFVLPP